MSDDKKENYILIRDIAYSSGATIFGVADISSQEIRSSVILSDELLNTGSSSLDRAIVFGVALSRKILETIKDRPNQIYYFHYQRINILIDHISLRITGHIQSLGYAALPIAASQIIDWESQKAAVDHREMARLAGLGWRGRNNLIVNPAYGAGIRLGTILTDMPLVCDSPLEKSNCGSCRKCIEVCPASAIKEDGFDKNSCHKKLKEFMKTERLGQMICGVCVRACPAPFFHTRSKKI